MFSPCSSSASTHRSLGMAHRQERPTPLSQPCKLRRGLVQGSYNAIYRMHLEGQGQDDQAGREVVVRVPFPGTVNLEVFQTDEKTMAEVATMLYISVSSYVQGTLASACMDEYISHHTRNLPKKEREPF